LLQLFTKVCIWILNEVWNRIWIVCWLSVFL
jgi:hypothetical protein